MATLDHIMLCCFTYVRKYVNIIICCVYIRMPCSCIVLCHMHNMHVLPDIGVARRLCNGSGAWEEPDLSTCERRDLWKTQMTVSEHLHTHTQMIVSEHFAHAHTDDIE